MSTASIDSDPMDSPPRFEPGVEEVVESYVPDVLDDSKNLIRTNQIVHLLEHARTTSDVAVDTYLKSTKLYCTDEKQGPQDWTDLPPNMKEKSDLYPKLFAIFQEVFLFYHPAGNIPHPEWRRPTRAIIQPPPNTLIEIHPEDNISPLPPTQAPDFFVTGAGLGFRCQDHSVSWRSCVSFIDVKTVREIVSDEKTSDPAWLQRFYTFAQQIFISQPNRLFVYGLVVTEQTFRIYRYDRGGVQASRWLDHRGKNARFLVMALVLISPLEPEDMGMDVTIGFAEDGLFVFNNLPGQCGRVKTRCLEICKRYQCPDLLGKGTVCWKVRDLDTVHVQEYILKQKFVGLRERPEGEILEKLKGVKGIPQLYVAKRVGITTAQLEWVKHPQQEGFHNQYLYRMLLEECGDTVDHAKHRVFLIMALRDAIVAHGAALLGKGILHGDVSVAHILLPVKKSVNYTTGGPRGYLIDFENAIDITKSNTYYVDPSKGSRAFKSIFGLGDPMIEYTPIGPKVVPVKQFLDCLDDLESFLWVLLWILADQRPPDINDERPTVVEPRSRLVMEFDHTEAIQSASYKEYCLKRLANNKPKDVIRPEWGHEIMDMAVELGAFFLARLGEKRALARKNRNIGAGKAMQDAPSHYKRVLDIFDRALANLEAEPDWQAIKDQLPKPEVAKGTSKISEAPPPPPPQGRKRSNSYDTSSSRSVSTEPDSDREEDTETEEEEEVEERPAKRARRDSVLIQDEYPGRFAQPVVPSTHVDIVMTDQESIQPQTAASIVAATRVEEAMTVDMDYPITQADASGMDATIPQIVVAPIHKDVSTTAREATITETRSASTQTRATIVETRSVATQTDPTITETRTMSTQTETTATETQTSSTQTETIVPETQIASAQVETIVTEAQPASAHTETTNTWHLEVPSISSFNFNQMIDAGLANGNQTPPVRERTLRRSKRISLRPNASPTTGAGVDPAP